MDFETLRAISNAVHFAGFPLTLFALFIETVNGYYNSRIPAKYR